MTVNNGLEQRKWVSIDDPDDETTWVIDVDFITSTYNCIYGDGCKSIEEEPDAVKGCCSVGAHFADDDDLTTVESYIERLTPAIWQNHELAAQSGGPISTKNDDVSTRIVDGACIFLNRDNFTKGAGCALHLGALEAGERPIDWKPMVCWQVPVRMDLFENEYGHTTATIRPWLRRDWGEGGEDFNWWCTESSEAYSSSVWVYTTLRDELIALMGKHIYDELGIHIQAAEKHSTPVRISKKR